MSSDGWEVRMSSTRQLPYYFNTANNTSTWERPSEISEENARNLPGGEHLEEYLKRRAEQPPQIRASHLLIKHKESRRPASWKEPTITRSKEEAIAVLKRHQADIDGAPDKAAKFGELAKVHSDCSSHDKNGDLGLFSRGQMQKPFEDAAFGLKVGEISDVVSTDSGVHLIMRTA